MNELINDEAVYRAALALPGYANNPNIKIGVLGMVDDTLSVQKNSVINTFVETQTFTLSEETRRGSPVDDRPSPD